MKSSGICGIICALWHFLNRPRFEISNHKIGIFVMLMFYNKNDIEFNKPVKYISAKSNFVR